MRLELTHVGLLVELANHYTTRGTLLAVLRPSSSLVLFRLLPNACLSCIQAGFKSSYENATSGTVVHCSNLHAYQRVGSCDVKHDSRSRGYEFDLHLLYEKIYLKSRDEMNNFIYKTWFIYKMLYDGMRENTPRKKKKTKTKNSLFAVIRCNLQSILLRCGTRPYERGTQWDSNSLMWVC